MPTGSKPSPSPTYSPANANQLSRTYAADSGNGPAPMITKDLHAYRVRNLHQEKGLRDHGVRRVSGGGPGGAGRQRKRTGRDSRPWMRLLGRQRSDDAGTASDRAGNRDS